MRVVCFFDGNCRLGNRGAGAAIVYDEEGNELGRRAYYIHGPETTNNIAEYRGLFAALDLARILGARQVKVLGDSELIIRQFNGQYRCLKEHLQSHLRAVRDASRQFDECVVEELPRSGKNGKRRNLNEEADAFATACMNAGRDLP